MGPATSLGKRFFENEWFMKRNMTVGLFYGPIYIVKMRVSWLVKTEVGGEDSL